MRLEGEVALITGGGSGIGRDTAVLFAKEGADIVVLDLDAAECQKTIDLAGDSGSRIRFVKADVSKSPEVNDAVQFCLERYGKLSVLCNCAGIWLENQEQRVSEMDEELWERILKVNLTGTFLCCKYAIRAMLKNTQGSIVNLSSIQGLIGSRSHAYSASKGGIISLTRSIATTYAANSIRANVICPGPVETPMTRLLMENPQSREYMRALVPLGRFAQPKEIAKMALYLASDESSWVTGSVFVIDGGYTAR